MFVFVPTLLPDECVYPPDYTLETVLYERMVVAHYYTKHSLYTRAYAVYKQMIPFNFSLFFARSHIFFSAELATFFDDFRAV